MSRIYLIIPALNEEKSIGKVIGDLPGHAVEEVIVVDNDSTDATGEMATRAGARVLVERTKGYGKACLTALSYLEGKATEDDIIAFMDGDYSDYPSDIIAVTEPISKGDYDMVIGSRTLGEREKGSLMPQQVFGNLLATALINMLYGVKFTDLGPFRAIRYKSLKELGMTDENYGWTAEMQVKAARKKIRCTEVPVNYRRRIGTSKVSGTFKGSVLAGYKIISTIIRHA